MSDNVPVEPGAEDERVRRLVGQAPEAAPSPDCRGRARAAFLTGDPDAEVPVTAAVPAVGRPPSRSRRWAAAGLAVAASLAGVAWFGSQPVDSWHVVGEHEMRLGESLVLRVAPGSDVSLPDPPGRWFGRTRELHVSTGSVFASSGGSALGFALVVTTDDARTRVTGTTFAVRCNARGTCVCLYEGALEVEDTGRHEVVRVPTGRRLQVYSGGEAPSIEPLDEGEIRMLEGLRDTL